MLNGTPWQFEKMTVDVDGLGEVVGHKSADWGYKLGKTQVTNRKGGPRGTIEGEYTGDAKIELPTQEALDRLETLSARDSEPLAVTFTWASAGGDSGTATLFLQLEEVANTDKKAEESMMTLTFQHADVMHANGSPVVDLEAAA
jgi:hypothetical protein